MHGQNHIKFLRVHLFAYIKIPSSERQAKGQNRR